MKTSSWPRVGVIAAVVLLGASLARAQGDELLVTNVQVQQRPGTHLVDVTYDLETVGDITVTISMSLSTDSGATYPYPCLTMTGDVGAGALPGVGKHIVWDAETDYPELSCTTCRLRVTADDGIPDAPAGFVAIPAGTFTMGSPEDEPGRWEDETQHQVTLTHGIYVQTTEVTNQQYAELAQWAYNRHYATATSASLRDALDGSTQELLDLDLDCEISFSGGTFTVDAGKADHPVMCVTWYGSVAYCDWLSLQQGLPRAYNHSTWQCNGGNPYEAAGYRLPTEAEWEYACRAGSSTAFANGPITYTGCSPIDPNLDLMGWYCGNDTYYWTHPVGQKLPNAWGLYDMHGNVWEWCNDWYDWYGGTATDPVGPGAGSDRVGRGGSWGNSAQNCRSALRAYGIPNGAGPFLGFRSVRSAN